MIGDTLDQENPAPTAAPVTGARRVRSDADLARAVIALVVTVAAFALATQDPTAARSFSVDVVHLVDRLSGGTARFLIGITQLVVIVAPVVLVIVAVRTRLVQILLAVGAAVIAEVIAAAGDRWMGDSIPPVVIEASHEPSWVIDASFPSGIYLASLAAASYVLTRHLDLRWRRLVGGLLIAVLVSRALGGVDSIFRLVSALALGITVASAVLYAIGFPPRRPRRTDIADELEAAGFEVDQVTVLSARATTGPTYQVQTATGPLFVTVTGTDARDADLFARMLRWFQVKGVEDERPVEPRFATEHEALNLALAARAGAAVPAVAAAGVVHRTGDSYLAMDLTPGRRLADLPVGELTDEVIAATFGVLTDLHRARIAHRRAGLEHFRLLDDGTVAATGLRWAMRAAPDRYGALDDAELLTSVASVVGVDRAVAVAADTLGTERLAATLPLLQPLAATPDTRRRARAVPGLMGELRSAVQEATGAEEYHLEPLRRVTLRTLMTFVATLIIGNLLLGLVANWTEIWDALRDADPAWIPLALVLVGLTYLTGALSMMGAVQERLGFGRSSLVMLAQSFLNRFTPANAGGMALRVRFLQRNGVDTVVAGGSVALTSLASGVMQVVFTVVFFTWAGSSAESEDRILSLPSGSTLLIAIAVLLAVAGIVAATTLGRRLWGRVRGSLVTMWHELGPLARRPGKLALLFGGAFAAKLVPVVILYVSVVAFDVHLGFAQVGAMYITATTVASASPTPGGVGAIEAALTAGLVSLGVPSATAAAIVLYFRFLTYWFPILPSWLGFRMVERLELA